jgi:integrase
MAYIRANKDKNGNIKSYTAEIYLGRDADGKKITKYVTREKRKDCSREAMKIELEHERKVTSNVGKKRVVDWYVEYLELNEGGKLSSGTIRQETGYLKNHFKPFFKQMRMEQVTDYHLKRLQSNLLKKLQPSTVRRIMLALSGAFKEGLKEKTPFLHFKIVKSNRPNVSAPSIEELVAILDATKGSRYEIPVLLAAWCGFRRSEILALRENDFDFVKNTIRIDEAWKRTKDNNYVIGPPKSEKGYRTERAPEELMTMIKTMLASRKVVDINSKNDGFLWNIHPDTFSNCFLRPRCW